MNKKILDFLILAIIVIVFLWFLQKNKNEHIDSNVDNITAKNITATGLITSNTGIVANNIGIGKSALGGSPNWGDINWGDGTGWKLNMGHSGKPTMEIYDNGTVRVNGDIGATGIVTAKKFVSSDGSTSSGPLSNEAIQSIASVYNKDNLTATNINATGNLTAANIIAPDALLGNIRIGKSVKAGSPNWGDISWGDGTGYRLNMGQSGNPSMMIYDNGSVLVGKLNDKQLSIGATALGGTPNWADINWGNGTGWRLNMGKAGDPTMMIYDNHNVIINGNLSTSGTLDVAGGYNPTRATTVLPARGGSTGTAFEDICPDGKVLVGFKGGANAYVDRIQGICR